MDSTSSVYKKARVSPSIQVEYCFWASSDNWNALVRPFISSSIECGSICPTSTPVPSVTAGSLELVVVLSFSLLEFSCVAACELPLVDSFLTTTEESFAFPSSVPHP